MEGRRTYDMVLGKWKSVRPAVGSNKRKSSGSTSFNTESGDAGINLNNIVADDDDEVCWIVLLNRSKPSACKEFAPLDNSKATILKH
ncbi:hypothetical protein Tco_1251394 [Tanacetum coccineum]